VSDLEKHAKKALLSTADGVLEAIGAKKPAGARKEPELARASPSSRGGFSPHYQPAVSSDMSKFEPTPEGIWERPCTHCGKRDRDGQKPDTLIVDEDWDRAEGVAHVLCDAEAFIKWGRESGHFERNRKLRAEIEERRAQDQKTPEGLAAREEEKARKEARRAMKRERRERLADQLGVPAEGKSLKDLRKIKSDQIQGLRSTKKKIVEKLVEDAESSDVDDVWIVD